MLTEEYIKRVKEIHNNDYDYDIVTDKVFARDLIRANCQFHGQFMTRMHDHLYHKTNCPECSRENKSHKNEFVDNARKVFGNLYDYSQVKYINSYTHVEINCQYHGSFMQVPYSHLTLKIGCPECSHVARTKDSEEFLEKANKIHNEFYNYDNVKYINWQTKIEINCPKHGSFWQLPKNHVYSNSGCPTCGNIKRSLTHNLNKDKYKLSKTGEGVLYLAKFKLESEEFLKIGLTTNNGINDRYGETHRGYGIKKIFEQKMLMVDVVNIERDIIELFHKEQHIPYIKFGGYTECFNITAKNDILNYINGKIK